MNFVLCMSFYDLIEKKRLITAKQLKHYINIRDEIENKYPNSKFNFILVGSEEDVSRSLVMGLGFREDEYFEFDQTPYSSNVFTIIEKKHLYSIEQAFLKYSNIDILFMNGSSDFIGLDFFKNAINNYISNSAPQLYGISGFNNDGQVILNDKFENRYYILNKDCLMSILNRSDANTVLNTKFIGGIFGINKHLLNILNNKLILPSGNEYELEKYLINNGGVPIFCDNFFFNFKVAERDVNSLSKIINSYNVQEINLEDLEIRIISFINYLKNL